MAKQITTGAIKWKFANPAAKMLGIPGLFSKPITLERLNKPNVIAAITAYEKRTGLQIIGKDIVPAE